MGQLCLIGKAENDENDSEGVAQYSCSKFTRHNLDTQGESFSF